MNKKENKKPRVHQKHFQKKKKNPQDSKTTPKKDPIEKKFEFLEKPGLKKTGPQEEKVLNEKFSKQEDLSKTQKKVFSSKKAQKKQDFSKTEKNVVLKKKTSTEEEELEVKESEQKKFVSLPMEKLYPFFFRDGHFEKGKKIILETTKLFLEKINWKNGDSIYKKKKPFFIKNEPSKKKFISWEKFKFKKKRLFSRKFKNRI